MPEKNDMYSKMSNLIIGFHGCEQSVRDKVVNGGSLDDSVNDYDWLGNGKYFWENDYERAFSWAKESSKIKIPSVVGAVIDLGYCLDLMNYKSVKMLKAGYELLKARCDIAGEKLPENINIKDNKDLLLRNLDCAVIQLIHEYSEKALFPKFDSVRGLFVEGEEVYPNSGFREKTHVQICVINPNCIKGYFIPREKNDKYIIP